MSANSKLGIPAASGPKRWVQTERAAHEAWAKLACASPRAAALLHHFVAMMGHQNAVVVSQKTLAAMMGCSIDTVQRAITQLSSGNWVQIVRLNGTGTVSAYVVNDQVAWGETRAHCGRLSVFSASIVAAEADQTAASLERKELRRIPALYPEERQLPSGEGMPPPSQPSFAGLEPDLPARIIEETEGV